MLSLGTKSPIPGSDDIEVYPLTVPYVNWHTFMGVSAEVLKRKIVAHLDESKTNLQKPSSFLSALGNFQDRYYKYPGVHLEIMHMAKHVHLGFLVRCTETDLLQLAYTTKLEISCSEERTLFVISATLDSWVEALNRTSWNHRTQEILAQVRNLLGGLKECLSQKQS